MRQLGFTLTVAAGLAVLGTAATGKEADKKEIIEKTVSFSRPSDAKEIIVDNLFGSITVTGTNSKEVRARITKTITARSEEKMKEAEKEVVLDILEEDNVMEFYVDGPFRERRGRNHGRGSGHEGYEVSFDFILEVPREASVDLKTVNEGEIKVQGVQGNFDVNNVNGGIAMDGMMGSGEAYAVNGDVTIDFDRNPDGDCRLGTLNGELKVYFQSPLSADFNLKTFNGDIYSDFEVTSLPAKASEKKKKDGMKVYSSGGITAVRAGNGGPEITLDGFNGDMYLIKK